MPLGRMYFVNWNLGYYITSCFIQKKPLCMLQFRSRLVYGSAVQFLNEAYESKRYLGIFEKTLNYFKMFATPKWIELPGDAIRLYSLPLAIGNLNEKRTFIIPAGWEIHVKQQTSRQMCEKKLEVQVQLENKIKVMDIYIHRCHCFHHGCCEPYRIHSTNQQTIDLISTFHQQNNFGVTGLGDSF